MEQTYKYRNPKFFWDRFHRYEKELYSFSGDAMELCNRLYKILQLYNPYIGFELSPELIKGKREMLFTANGDEKLFTVVNRLVEGAPKSLKDRWNFLCLRPPAEVGDVIVHFDGKEISSSEFLYDLEPSPSQKGKFDILIHIRGISFDNSQIEEEVCEAAFLIIEGIIGERAMGENLSAVVLVDETDMKSPRPIMKLKNEKWSDRK